MRAALPRAFKFQIFIKLTLYPTPKCLGVNTVVGILSLYVEKAARTGMTGQIRYKVMSNELEQKNNADQHVVYQIRLKGHLVPQWTNWFEGLIITLEEEGDTLLTGPVIDQAALHGLLKKVRDLGLPLVSVSQVQFNETHPYRSKKEKK
jgi:hypothetical protein